MTAGIHPPRTPNCQEHAEQWAREADTSTVTQVAHDFDAGTQALLAELSRPRRGGCAAIAGGPPPTSETRGCTASMPTCPTLKQLEQLPEFQLSAEERERGWVWRATPVLASPAGSWSMTSMAAHLLLATISPFAIIGVGGLVAAALLKSGKQQADKAHAREDVYRHIQTAINHIRVEVPVALQDGMEAYQNRDHRADLRSHPGARRGTGNHY